MVIDRFYKKKVLRKFLRPMPQVGELRLGPVKLIGAVRKPQRAMEVMNAFARAWILEEHSMLSKTFLAVAGLVFARVLHASAELPQAFQLNDLIDMHSVSDAVVSPTGRQVAVVTQYRTTDTYLGRKSALWLVSTTPGKVPKRIASGYSPAWSADGKLLTYLGSDYTGVQLYLWDVESSHAITLSACDEDEQIQTYAWAPNDRRLAVICSRAPSARHYESPIILASQSSLYNGDGQHSVTSAKTRLLVVEATEDNQRRLLVEGKALVVDNGAIAWDPSGDALWFVEWLDDASQRRQLLRVDIESQAISALQENSFYGLLPVVSPSGRDLLVVAGNTRAFSWKRLLLQSPVEFRRVRASDGKLLSLGARSDIFIEEDAAPKWVAAAKGEVGGVVYYSWLDRASARIGSYNPNTQQWRDITPAGINIKAFSISADGTKMVVVQGSANVPSDVFLIDLRVPTADPVRLTHFGDLNLKKHTLAEVEALSWRSGDDRFTVHGWLIKPANRTPGKRYPLIVDVHGGPAALYRNDFESIRYDRGGYVPPELYAAHGYMVLRVNPRGDPSYGREFREALREGWSAAVRYDILSGVDEVIRRGEVDPEMLGIAGASFGGWAAAFAVSQTGRFKAASANDPVIDTSISSSIAYQGLRGSNYWVHAGFAGGLQGDEPFPTVDPRLVKTPTLLRFGLKGRQSTHPSQFFISGLPFFVYLDTHCIPVEMILHAQEGHGIEDWQTMSDYVSRNIRWFDYWIKGEGERPIRRRRECENSTVLW